MPATTPRGAPETNGNAGGESWMATCCTNSVVDEELDSEDFGRVVVPHGLDFARARRAVARSVAAVSARK